MEFIISGNTGYTYLFVLISSLDNWVNSKLKIKNDLISKTVKFLLST